MSIGSLQFIFANNAGSTLAGPINNSTTSLSVASGGGALFPTPVVGTQQFAITLIDAATGLLREVCYVTAVSVDTFTILRGQEGTSSFNWLAGDLVQELWTAGQCAAMLQTSQTFVTGTVFYVNSTTGNDSNPGTNTLPFRTGQGAISAIKSFISTAIITVNFASGTYDGFTINNSSIAGWTIIGSGVGTCSIVSSTTSVNSGNGVVNQGSKVALSGFSISAHFNCVASASTGAVTTLANCNFIGLGTTSSAIFAPGGQVALFSNPNPGTTNTSNFIFSGAYGSIFIAGQGGTILSGYNDTFTIANSVFTFLSGVSVSNEFAFSSQSSSINFVVGNVTFVNSGNVTGKKFVTNGGAGISNPSGGLSYLPGTIAGTVDTATGGWYLS